MQQEVFYHGKIYRKKDEDLYFILTIVLGWLGVHRFLFKQWGMGILYLFTSGLWFVGWIYDIFTIRRKVKEWNHMVDEMIKQKELEEAKRQGQLAALSNLKNAHVNARINMDL